MAGGYYRTGDIGSRDEDGYLTYVGRADDVFKASRLQDQPVRAGERAPGARAVAEGGRRARPRRAAARRPEAYVVLAEGVRDRARTPPSCCSSTPAPCSPRTSGLRRIEFGELPKTVSGKIRRIELREATAKGSAAGVPREDFR